MTDKNENALTARAEPDAVEKAATDLSALIADLRFPKSERRQSPWNSLEVLKLIAGFAIASGVAASGFLVTAYFRQQDAVKERRIAAKELSKAIFERYTRSVMLYRSLQRQSSSLHPAYEEVERRKRDYDEAFVHFHTNIGGYIVALRTISVSATKGEKYQSPSELENHLQTLVVTMFTPIHTCLTDSFVVFFQEKSDPMPGLKACDVSNRLDRTVECGKVLTEQVHLLVDKLVTWSDADKAIKKSCPIEKWQRS